MGTDNATTTDSAGTSFMGEDTPPATTPVANTNSVLAGDEGANTSAVKPADGDAAASDNNPGGKAGEGDQNAIVYTDFTMPDGLTIDAALLNEATPIFKELGLTQDQAQKLVDFQAKQIQTQTRVQIDAFNQQLDQWISSAKKDSEYGGDKFDQNVALARSAINKFGTPELKQLLNEYGVGSHPEFIRLMVRVGKLTAEDNPSKGNPTPVKQDNATILYPNDIKNA